VRVVVVVVLALPPSEPQLPLLELELELEGLHSLLSGKKLILVEYKWLY
jgi:hypothetical protein